MTELNAAILFADLSLILLMARVAGRVAHRLGQPAVIGEIVGGVLLGPTLFHGALAHTLFPVDVRPPLSALADLGLVLFMFVVGLEVDFGRVRGCGRIAAGTVLGSAAVPFALGALLALHLLRERHPASRAGFIVFIAVAVSVTAFPVLARILTDRSMSGTWLGTIALTSAAVCDLFAWAALAGVQVLTGSGGRAHWLVLLVVPYGLLLFTCGRPLLARALRSGRPGGTASAGGLAVVLTGLLVSAAVTQALGLHFVLGAFLFGLVMPREAAGLKSVLLPRVQFTTTLLLPVYFIVAGLNTDLSRIGMAGLGDLGLILAVAVTGKFAGTWIGARSQGLGARRSAVLATLMNTRGLTELIALSVGLQIGLLDHALYAEMVVMAVATTVMTGPLLRCVARPDDRLPMRQEQEKRHERAPMGAAGGDAVVLLGPASTGHPAAVECGAVASCRAPSDTAEGDWRMTKGAPAGATAEPLLQMAADFYKWRTVLFAVELGLFTALLDTAMTPDEVCDRFGVDRRGAGDFLDALVSVGLLERADGSYRAAPVAARFLDGDKAAYLGRFLQQADARWSRVGEGLLTGEPQNGARPGAGMFVRQHRSRQEWRAYYGGMDALNGPSGRALGDAFDWGTVKRVTDVGGARGNVLAELVRAHPHLEATVFDLPAVEPVFTEHMAELGLTGRVAFRPGDFFHDALPESEVVVFGHVLHDWDVEQRRHLARRAFEAVAPGGYALAYDTMIDEDRRTKTNSLLVSLNMMLCTPGGGEYTPSEGARWFADAGFAEVSHRPLAGDDTLLVAHRTR